MCGDRSSWTPVRGGLERLDPPQLHVFAASWQTSWRSLERRRCGITFRASYRDAEDGGRSILNCGACGAQLMTNARSPGRAFDPYNHSLASEMRTVHILAIAALIGWSIERVFWWPVRHHWRSEARAATWYQRYMP